MGRTRALMIGVALSMIALVYPSPAHTSAAARRSSRQVVTTVNCAHTMLEMRPHTIGVSCDQTFKFYGIHWRRWGRLEAVGIGRGRLQNCEPFCADGEVTRPRAKLRLTHVVTVAGIWMFARLSYSLLGRLPAGYTRHHGVLHMLPAGQL